MGNTPVLFNYLRGVCTWWALILYVLCGAGCASTALAPAQIPPDKLTSMTPNTTLVWGFVDIGEIWNIDTGYARVYSPGLLPMIAGSSSVEGTLLLREQTSGRQTVVTLQGAKPQIFSCVLPAGSYSARLEVTWPTLRLNASANKSILCAGKGDAVFVGVLKLGSTADSKAFLYDDTENFVSIRDRFLSENPQFHGVLVYQKIAVTVVPRK